MDARIKVKYYVEPNGKVPFLEWFNDLKDAKAQLIIDRRLATVRVGSFGDCEFVGEGVRELKIHYGPGYRIYFGQAEKNMVLLLAGGIKGTQNSDIRKAHQFWMEYKGTL